MNLDYSGEPMPAFFDTDDLGPAYELIFNWRRPPLTANDRHHYMVKARITKQIREASFWMARQLRLPELPKITVAMTWVVADKRKRDGSENLAPTLKALIDGLVDAGVVIDDDQAHVVRGPSLIEYRQGDTPHIVLHVAPVRPEGRGAVA